MENSDPIDELMELRKAKVFSQAAALMLDAGVAPDDIAPSLLISAVGGLAESHGVEDMMSQLRAFADDLCYQQGADKV